MNNRLGRAAEAQEVRWRRSVLDVFAQWSLRRLDETARRLEEHAAENELSLAVGLAHFTREDLLGRNTKEVRGYDF